MQLLRATFYFVFGLLGMLLGSIALAVVTHQIFSAELNDSPESWFSTVVSIVPIPFVGWYWFQKWRREYGWKKVTFKPESKARS